jgi:hypothetical protein
VALPARDRRGAAAPSKPLGGHGEAS